MAPFTREAVCRVRSKPIWNPFAVLEPVADGFRNYLKGKYSVLGDRCSLIKHNY